MGFAQERVIKAQRPGIFRTNHDIGDRIEQGEKIGVVVLLFAREDLYQGVPVDSEYPVVARIAGVIRGLAARRRAGGGGDKIGDIDPRGDHRRPRAHLRQGAAGRGGSARGDRAQPEPRAELRSRARARR